MRTWKRHPEGYGYVSVDGEWFLERGGRMSDGGTVWLGWQRADAAEIPRHVSADPGAYVHGGEWFSVGGVIYAYRWDVESLRTAKAVTEAVAVDA